MVANIRIAFLITLLVLCTTRFAHANAILELGNLPAADEPNIQFETNQMGALILGHIKIGTTTNSSSTALL